MGLATPTIVGHLYDMECLGYAPRMWLIQAASNTLDKKPIVRLTHLGHKKGRTESRCVVFHCLPPFTRAAISGVTWACVLLP